MIGYYWNLGKVLTISTASTTCAHISKIKFKKGLISMKILPYLKFYITIIPFLTILVHTYSYFCILFYTSPYFLYKFVI